MVLSDYFFEKSRTQIANLCGNMRYIVVPSFQSRGAVFQAQRIACKNGNYSCFLCRPIFLGALRSHKQGKQALFFGFVPKRGLSCVFSYKLVELLVRHIDNLLNNRILMPFSVALVYPFFGFIDFFYEVNIGIFEHNFVQLFHALQNFSVFKQKRVVLVEAAYVVFVRVNERRNIFAVCE